MATAAKEKKQDTKEPEVKATGRSASYPWIDLETAVERLGQFWKEEKAYEVPIASAYKHWGYGAKSSGARLTLAAMLNYGLLTDRGANEKRTVKATPLAIDLVMPPSAEAKARALKVAAQKPRVFAELLKTMDPSDLPSDQTIAHYLVTQKGFNPNSTQTFMKNFKGTIKYANLKKSDILSSGEPIPAQQEQDEGETGLKVKDQLLVDHAPNTGTPPAKSAVVNQRGFKQDVYTLGEEGQVILQWPEKMSAESYAELEDWIALQMRKIARLNEIKTDDKKK